MKLSTTLSTILISGSSICTALSGSQDSLPSRSLSNTCSIGIGRVSGTINWDATIYDVPSSQRQDINVVGTATFVSMDRGQSMTVTGPPTVTVSNVDNAPVFAYDEPEQQAPVADPANGLTKVNLHFSSGGRNWTSAEDCSAGNVIFSAGRESWSCDFAC